MWSAVLFLVCDATAGSDSVSMQYVHEKEQDGSNVVFSAIRMVKVKTIKWYCFVPFNLGGREMMLTYV